ncbi:chromosome condensation protein CrcB [Natronococcus pandeyae]|uniref:Fluoride-specific ion channel FluC n=1 Tax=Natronococcus pandeyae TaxID=2055836 RepID=A0A8J8Q023_9EURY|nr:CrcB family protein [Natronococcus pandeyae]TYL36916.1 chromosome condensation protein CrcB [Natronococcus pandeyae]
MTVRDRLADIEVVGLVVIGGFLGANARYGIGLLYPGLTGTFVANVTGSFVLGFVVYEAMYTDYLTDRGRLLVSTGFISSYTTYSTFAYETVAVEPLLGLLNVGASYSFGFAGVVLGRWVALRIRGGSRE